MPNPARYQQVLLQRVPEEGLPHTQNDMQEAGQDGKGRQERTQDWESGEISSLCVNVYHEKGIPHESLQTNGRDYWWPVQGADVRARAV